MRSIRSPGVFVHDYLAPKPSHPYRFDPAQVPGWPEYYHGLADYVAHELGVPSELHERYTHWDTGKGERIIMDRIHLLQEGAELQGIVSAFRVFYDDHEEHDFVHTFEARLDHPPIPETQWLRAKRRILDAAKATGLHWNRGCNPFLPIFHEKAPAPRISDFKTLVAKVRVFAKAFPLAHSDGAGEDSMNLGDGYIEWRPR